MIFTAILRLERLPACWNTTWTSLLYKSRPTTVVSNYRPISIVNFFVKMMDGIILQRSSPLLEGSNRLNRMQWAGRADTGCQEALGLVDACLDYSNRNKDRGEYVYTAMVDVWKAYDTVPWDALFARLARIGLPTLAKLLRIIYSELFVTFKTGVGFTDRLRLRNGIAQGMQSSPLAYIIFVNPLIATLASMEGGFKMTPKTNDGSPVQDMQTAVVRNVSIIDDLILLSDNLDDLQRRTDLTLLFGHRNNQFISLKKTQGATNDPAGAILRIDASQLCPPERADRVVEMPLMDENGVFRYLGIFRSIADRGAATLPSLDGKLYTVLSHMLRKPLPPALATCIYHAMVESVFIFFAPWVNIPKAKLRQWDGAIRRVFQKTQGLPKSTQTALLTCVSVCGIRPLETVLEGHCRHLHPTNQYVLAHSARDARQLR
jgi:hypothetical protein